MNGRREQVLWSTLAHLFCAHAVLAATPKHSSPRIKAVNGHCPAGRYSALTMFDAVPVCLECPSGKFLDKNAPPCFGCAPGHTQCSMCSPGQYAEAPGSTKCHRCAFGQYQGDVGKAHCTLCDSGKASLARGSSTCTDCSPGQFAGNAGAFHCKDCGDGTYADTPGEQVCKACIAGRYGLKKPQETGLTNGACTGACKPGRYETVPPSALAQPGHRPRFAGSH